MAPEILVALITAAAAFLTALTPFMREIRLWWTPARKVSQTVNGKCSPSRRIGEREQKNES